VKCLDGKTIANYGYDFEKRVRRAFARNGYAFVDNNCWKRNYNLMCDAAEKREFDLVLFNSYEWNFCIVECKAHLNKHNLVSLEQVMMFDHKLRNYGGSSAVPILVTDTGFRRNALDYGKQACIELMDGYSFTEFEKDGSILKEARSKVVGWGVRKSLAVLEQNIKSLF
jgi:hypothetical protein